MTWWSASWSALNSLSGGPAPTSFKGFASDPSATPPACGGTWKTHPGNSSKPPASARHPQLHGAVVTSKVTKSGNKISGNITHIVVIKTNPGYGPNPGHTGTGTIVGTYC